MLYQLHWQNPKELSQTIMVMQGEANSPDGMEGLAAVQPAGPRCSYRVTPAD